MDVVNVEAVKNAKAIRVSVSRKVDYKTEERVLDLSFYEPRSSTSQAITIDEAEQLYYKLRWELQEAGVVALGPFLWRLTAEVYQPRSKNPLTPRVMQYTVIAATEEDAKHLVHRQESCRVTACEKVRVVTAKPAVLLEATDKGPVKKGNE